jgi:putative molybdopterin biosynthesis protein
MRPASDLPVRNRLRELRSRRGIPAAQLAQVAGISRQTIYAIEDGSYVPNTAIALQLARILDVRVEDIFVISESSAPKETTLKVDVLAETASEQLVAGCPVRLCQVGDRTLAVPVPPFASCLPEAEAVVEKVSSRSAVVRTLSETESPKQHVLIAGCDPALSFFNSALKGSDVEVITASCSSQKALRWLKEGHVHIAGSHIVDHATGEYNVPIVRRKFSDGGAHVVTFASWRQGLIVRLGNPKGIRSVADLARKDVKIVNRDPGSGSRGVLDRQLTAAGIRDADVLGYGQIVAGHLAAAYAVMSQAADCCIANESAARRFGLGFIPLTDERFDLTVARDSLLHRGVQVVLDALQRAGLRNRLAALAGYDVQYTGKVQLG